MLFITLPYTTREVHDKVKNSVCSVCSRAFANESDLRAHFTDYHVNITFCPECPGFSGRLNDVKKHVRKVHRGENTYDCQECQSYFFKKSLLIVHISRVHENEKPFVCPKCLQSFGWKGVMNNHIKRVHKGQLNYMCPDCNNTFF